MNPLTSLTLLPQVEQEIRGIRWTPKEIARQARVWPTSFQIVEERITGIKSFLEACGFAANLQDRPTVFLIGAGTSDFVGKCLVGLLRQNWQCEIQVVPSTDLLTNFHEYLIPSKRRLWISISRSGNSPEGIAVLQRALVEEPQIAHIVISCDGSGRMTQMIQGQDNCLSLVLSEETNDEGLAMTGSFTNMLICGHALSHAWNLEAYRLVLEELCRGAEEFLAVAATSSASLATQGFKRVCFIGSGSLAGVAAESALKLLELTAGTVKTMAQTTLGLRHGPMSALDADTMLVAFLSSDEIRRRYELDLLREIELKGLVRRAIVIDGTGSAVVAGLRKTELIKPTRKSTVPDLYRPVIDVLFAQCLGLFSSLHYGLTPDSPSPNGAISRVVPSFGIY